MNFPKDKKVIDEPYLDWLGKQPCVIFGCKSVRGVGMNDMHIHHVRGRRPRNDHEAVPMLGYCHSWGSKALHNLTKSEFIREYNLPTHDLREYLLVKARELRQQYLEEI